MRDKSMLFKYLHFLLLAASFTLPTRTINAEENGTDVNDTITATASLLRDSYTLGQPVPIEIVATNHGQEPVYIDVDEFGYLGLWVTVEDVNGTKIEHGPIPSPPPTPRHWWITIDGKKIYTVPIVEIEPRQTTKLTIQDALNLYHDYLQEGVYYVKPRELSAIHKVDSIIVREDQEHKLWIQPSAVIGRARYEINKVKMTLYQEKTIYVDDDAIGLNNGSSWENAYTFLQDALVDADSAEKPVEIRVAQGIYTPDENSISPEGTGDRKATFQLIKNVTIKGGYAGFGEPDPNARDIDIYQTILSGDLNGNDVEVNDPCDLLSEPSRYDNSENVIIGSNTYPTAVLDGFTITGGYLIVPPHMGSGDPSGGAGMYISYGSPTVVNCIFTGNATLGYGGGMIIIAGSNPTVVNCTFTKNNAGGGGGISFWKSPEGINPTLIDCMFDDNYASGDGGGMYNYQNNTNMTNCIFSSNFSHRYGGGIYNRMSNIELANCTFNENSADSGGGIYSEDKSNLTLTNCTFRSNSAEWSGGGMCNSDANDIILTSSIFNGNSVCRGGGGLGSNHNKLLMINCVLDGNKAYGGPLPYTYKGQGGGLYIFGDTEIIDCAFHNNWTSEGAGIYIYSSNLALTGCAFSGNVADSCGGGVYNGRTWNYLNVSIANSTFSGNKAKFGGGIFNTWASRIGIDNSTFTDNLAFLGNALACDPNHFSLNGYIELTNCIIWDNDNAIFDLDPNGLTFDIIYSDIQNGWEGEGNIDTDPFFVNPGYWADADDPNIAAEPNDPNAVWVEGDYRLKSQAGRWDPASQSWVVDDVTSPCIDAGDPNMPVGDEPMPNGGRVNMGAYGGTPQASKSNILAKTIYVDDDAVGLNDGSSWQNAYNFLQDALTTARQPEVEKPLEIRVAQGTYKPNEGLLPIVAPGPPFGRWPQPGVWPADEGHLASFDLLNGVTIKGGYAGVNEPDPNVRDVKPYESILSGDLNGNDIETDDPCDLLDELTRSDNSVHVIVSVYNDANAVIDGFTITGGQDESIASSGWTGGAGISIGYGNPTLIDCTFARNVVLQVGGGMYNISSSPTLINCVFTENYAEWGSGIYNGVSRQITSEHSNPRLINCAFIDNNARWIGGGIYNEGGNSSLLNCTFIRNSAGGFCGGGNPEFVDCEFIQNDSGGIYTWGSPRLTNCIFRSNSTKYYGGGMSSEGTYGIILTNCIFSDNSAGRSGGGLLGRDFVLNNCIFTGNKIYGEESHLGEGGGCVIFGDNTTMTNCTFYGNWARHGRAIFKSSDSVLSLNNCILWDGGDEISRNHPSTLTITYSDIQGGLEGEGNINADPLFADPGYWANAYDPNAAVEPYEPNAVWVDGDYHLKSQAGRWDPANQSRIQDDVTSPCIDAGNPNSPIGHEPFPNGGIINMGAYGGTPQASKSLTTTNRRF